MARRFGRHGAADAQRKDGYELIPGASPDPQFGPVVLFGTGGNAGGGVQDRALGISAASNTTLARPTMTRTKIYQASAGRARDRPLVDLVEPDKIFVRFSELVNAAAVDQEIDINPLFASHAAHRPGRGWCSMGRR